MDRSKLLVGAYYYNKNLYDENHMKNLKEMGIDFLVAVPADKALLDLCDKYGIKVILSGTIPGWYGANGDNAGTYKDSIQPAKLEELKESYPFHNAIWGDYLVDEPNAKDFTHIDVMAKKYEQVFPGLFPYINLYPNYASVLPSPDSDAVSQLGNISYKEHIAQYVREIENDYICFDNYPYTGDGPFNRYLENLDIVSTACRDSGRDMWVIIQTGAWKAPDIIGEFQIRWQTYLCLAYGTRLIMHASYSHGWWDHTTSCVNKEGEKNPTYYYAQTINGELHSLSDIFMQYRHLGLYISGDPAVAHQKLIKQLEGQSGRNAERDGFAGIEAVEVNSDEPVAVGCFEKRDGAGYAVMLVNASDPFDESAAVTASLKFKPGAKPTAYRKARPAQLQPDANGACTIKLEGGEGVFITID